MIRASDKKYLLFMPIGKVGYDGFLLETVLKKIPGLGYWCYAEHTTPLGVSVLYVYLSFYHCIAYKDLHEHLSPFNGTIDVLSNFKSSRLYRDYVKTKGFSWNLGKSRPIPGTFNEKEGGL